MATMTTTGRIEELRASLQIAADLIGPDILPVDSEYTRALSEFGCMNSGISTIHKEAFENLAIQLAQTPRPEASAASLVNDLEVSALLIGDDIDVTLTERPERLQALCEHACVVAEIDSAHADSVHDLLIGVLTND